MFTKPGTVNTWLEVRSTMHLAMTALIELTVTVGSLTFVVQALRCDRGVIRLRVRPVRGDGNRRGELSPGRWLGGEPRRRPG